MLNEESASPAEEKARPRFLLKLDHDDVYFGCEALPDGGELSLGPDDVVLDHAPDNAPGQYRWLREEKRFHALLKTQQKTAPGAPTLEQAFYELTQSWLQGAGPNSLPPRVEAWRTQFRKTLDGAGS
jgi:hypothetical protein